MKIIRLNWILTYWPVRINALDLSSMKNIPRPKYLNLFKIHLPLTGVVSILHRLSGVILFLCIPLSIYALQYSLANEQGFTEMQQAMNTLGGKVLAAVVIWSAVHHLLAGIRFLLTDLNIGLALKAARASAWLVMLLAILLTAWLVWRCCA